VDELPASTDYAASAAKQVMTTTVGQVRFSTILRREYSHVAAETIPKFFHIKDII
jgi:hypothetical protein